MPAAVVALVIQAAWLAARVALERAGVMGGSSGYSLTLGIVAIAGNLVAVRTLRATRRALAEPVASVFA